MLRKINWVISEQWISSAFSFEKLKVQLVFPLSPCFRPKLSSFKFLTSFGILALAWGLAEAVKISSLLGDGV